MYKFRVHIALLMNITPDHLDRYHYNFEEYAMAKMRILQNQTAEDASSIGVKMSSSLATS